MKNLNAKMRICGIMDLLPKRESIYIDCVWVAQLDRAHAS